MKKEIFVKLIKELVALKKSEDLLKKALNDFDSEFNLTFLDKYETLIVDCLKEAMDDTSSWIDYWIYDCEKGTKKIGKGVKDNKTGKIIPFKTAENLYDCIKKY